MDSGVAIVLAAADLAPGPYTSPIKVAIVVVLILLWALGTQWIDRDTDKTKTRREQWNLIVLSGGAVATFVLLAVPVWSGSLFVVGLLFWLLLAGGAMMAYVVHRNGRVAPNARVLTFGHAKRLLGGVGGAKRPKDKGQRVQITDHNGKFVELPDDTDDVLAYQALQDFLFDLLWRRASDADIVAGKEKYRLVFKIDGVASEKEGGLAPEIGERVFRFLKKPLISNSRSARSARLGVLRWCR